MALVNPQIAMSYRPAVEYQPRNALAEYAQIQQIVGAQEQQQLNALKMQEAKAALDERNALRQLDPNSPDYEAQLFRVNPATGIAYRKELAAAAASRAAQRKSEIETTAAKQGMLGQAYRDISQRPSDANITAHMEDVLASDIFGDAEKNQVRSRAQQLLAMPYAERVSFLASQGAKASELKPQVMAQATGATTRLLSVPAQGGAATVVPGSEVTLTPTISETTAQGQLTLAQQKLAWEQANPGFEIKEGENGFLLAVNKRTGVAQPVTMGDLNKPVKGNTIAQQRLAFDQQKFAWEKANPGYELKEGENGVIYGVNKRTLQAVPVSVGAGVPGAANALVPGAAVPGAAPAAAPSAPTPAVSAAPGVAAPGTPLKGKGSSLTESQSNAVAFGMRMADADATLRNLESSGVTSGGRIRGFVEGALTSLVPFQGEQLAQGAGAVVNALPGALGGPSPEQQQYAQAKLNFVTAVLRKESGAAISPAEFANEDKKYFPQAGDSDKVVQQKRRARELAIQAMKVQAGPGGKDIGVAKEGDANDPLGIRK